MSDFGPKLGLIGTERDKSGTFCTEYLALKVPDIIFGANRTQFWPKFRDFVVLVCGPLSSADP